MVEINEKFGGKDEKLKLKQNKIGGNKKPCCSSE